MNVYTKEVVDEANNECLRQRKFGLQDRELVALQYHVEQGVLSPEQALAIVAKYWHYRPPPEPVPCRR
ncbi:MAG: hypothetical protein OIF35_05290 [Cellvibrionaceae bacterium]|nr:hypothetical protein [Cellvibrionaceae bacterium]